MSKPKCGRCVQAPISAKAKDMKISSNCGLKNPPLGRNNNFVLTKHRRNFIKGSGFELIDME
jgi:hypothetical protein